MAADRRRDDRQSGGGAVASSPDTPTYAQPPSFSQTPGVARNPRSATRVPSGVSPVIRATSSPDKGTDDPRSTSKARRASGSSTPIGGV